MFAFRGIIVTGVAALVACGADEPADATSAPTAPSSSLTSETSIDDEEIGVADEIEANAPVDDPETPILADHDYSADLALLASSDALRPANFYRVEWAADNAVCAAALLSLNKPFATPLDLRTAQDATGAPMGARDYGSHQAAFAIGTHDNVRWSWRKIDAGTPIESEIAFVDFFNDGVERLVLRTRGARAGDYVIDFAVRNADGAGPLLESLNYARAGAAHSDLPDQDNLRSKLSRSVKDLISVNNSVYTLIAPLKDYDPSGRIYLATWRPGAGKTQWRAAGDYYPDLVCAFAPRDTDDRTTP